MVSNIRTCEESFFAENGGYLDVSGCLGTNCSYPSQAPGKFAQAWGGPCGWCTNPATGWSGLSVAPQRPPLLRVLRHRRSGRSTGHARRRQNGQRCGDEPGGHGRQLDPLVFRPGGREHHRRRHVLYARVRNVGDESDLHRRRRGKLKRWSDYRCVGLLAPRKGRRTGRLGEEEGRPKIRSLSSFSPLPSPMLAQSSARCRRTAPTGWLASDKGVGGYA